ncbi:hypothetical protein PP7435_CHR3-2535 [Komagataella phaffii CBS 7435]|uniref:PUM-HD domain-containing protein n=2 Tax=Komagataella phaffii TaxID=460519 RepID=C4R405_KOMPG|nr:uncharacterized protein PAS_chr3_1171 [Komagataella phaffii GS115]AOA63501.1 GQ67_03305T0 [Komagataella phaffii]CAH2449966.1 hypothetical protein BQ9382_C3-5090 [Komagataella phaffii CBS 7435]AOA68609.1 GQ68_03274T0 [Komagataella phaffii GS115]CAY70291.1 hypothetical protein PAS_chr3_1171 [Komagataella phaffii GS115]SCV12284.1 hypothetical protein PP7435_CHR3-2535 [Komagataella phaffii CBS 7435]
MVSAVEPVPVRVSDRSDDLISEPSSFVFRSLSKEIYNTVHNNQETVEEEYFCPNLDTDLHHEMAALKKALKQISEKLECLSQGGSTPSRGRPISRFQETSINFDALVDRIVKKDDQYASYQLQQKLECRNNQELVEIMDSIQRCSLELMVNRFGNFLIQKCFEVLENSLIEGLIITIARNIVQVSTDAFGCHVVQKALEMIQEGHKKFLVEYLLEHLESTLLDSSAEHVWKRVLEIKWAIHPEMEEAITAKLSSTLQSRWLQVATTPRGSLIVQNILTNLPPTIQKTCLEELERDIPTLLTDRSGNWVIQFILQHFETSEIHQTIFQTILDNSQLYSTQMYSSKVIQKCLKAERFKSTFIDPYIDAICSTKPSKRRKPGAKPVVIELAVDIYGSGIIRKILVEGSVDEKSRVNGLLQEHMETVCTTKWGSKCAAVL